MANSCHLRDFFGQDWIFCLLKPRHRDRYRPRRRRGSLVQSWDVRFLPSCSKWTVRLRDIASKSHVFFGCGSVWHSFRLDEDDGSAVIAERSSHVQPQRLTRHQVPTRRDRKSHSALRPHKRRTRPHWPRSFSFVTFSSISPMYEPISWRVSHPRCWSRYLSVENPCLEDVSRGCLRSCHCTMDLARVSRGIEPSSRVDRKASLRWDLYWPTNDLHSSRMHALGSQKKDGPLWESASLLPRWTCTPKRFWASAECIVRILVVRKCLNHSRSAWVP